MKKPGLYLNHETADLLLPMLTDEQAGKLLRALIRFSEGGEREPQEDPVLRAAYGLFAAETERMRAAYEKKCASNRKGYEKRRGGAQAKTEGEPSGEEEGDGADPEPREAPEPEREEDGEDSACVQHGFSAQNKKEQNETRRIQNPLPSGERKGPRFSPPSREEVSAYCRERGAGVDPDAFLSYYGARGWRMNGGGEMRDWRAALRAWETNVRRWKEEHDGRKRTDGGADRVPGQRDLYRDAYFPDP